MSGLVEINQAEYLMSVRWWSKMSDMDKALIVGHNTRVIDRLGIDTNPLPITEGVYLLCTNNGAIRFADNVYQCGFGRRHPEILFDDLGQRGAPPGQRCRAKYYEVITEEHLDDSFNYKWEVMILPDVIPTPLLAITICDNEKEKFLIGLASSVEKANDLVQEYFGDHEVVSERNIQEFTLELSRVIKDSDGDLTEVVFEWHPVDKLW